MKTSRQIQNHLFRFCMVCFSFFIMTTIKAQLCINSKDSVYGLTTTGQLVAVSLLNGGGYTIGSPAAGAVNSNAVGFSAITGLFYFFNKNGAAPQQFVSYNPVNSALTPLAASPI